MSLAKSVRLVGLLSLVGILGCTNSLPNMPRTNNQLSHSEPSGGHHYNTRLYSRPSEPRGGNPNFNSYGNPNTNSGNGIPGIQAQPTQHHHINHNNNNGHHQPNVPYQPNSRPANRPNLNSNDNYPRDNGNQAIPVKNAFKGCETHDPTIEHGKPVAQHFESEAKPMKHNSHIAFYPLTQSNEPMELSIKMPSMQFKAMIDSSNVVLNRCSADGITCHEEDIVSSKGGSLLHAEQWNYIYSQIKKNQIVIGIGEKTEVMSMRNLPEEELEAAEWFVSSRDNNFAVQYPCAEYVAHHLPSTTVNPFSSTGAPHYTPEPRVDSTYSPPLAHVTGAHVYGHTTEKPSHEENPSAGSHAAIIVGVIVALLLVALVIAIAVSVVRKRKAQAYKPSEDTPLDNQQQQNNLQQQQQ